MKMMNPWPLIMAGVAFFGVIVGAPPTTEWRQLLISSVCAAIVAAIGCVVWQKIYSHRN